jgi:hypothetical protein
MQLRTNDNKVDIWTFPETIITPAFAQRMLTEWRNSTAEIEFPEGTTHFENELSVAEPLLPEGFKTERPDIIQRAQTEWNFMVLSTKLHEAYRSELSELEDKINKLTDYSGDIWESLKGFWNKVQGQVRERNLFREHADILRDNTNELFDKLKQMRSSMTNEFEESSKSIYAKFNEILDEIEKKVEQGIQNFPLIFEDLKKTQVEFRNHRLTREHSNDVWNRIDSLFKSAKEKKFGGNAINDVSALERLTRRYEGLIGAIDKMQESIDRDKQELEFQNKRIANTQGQLEAQIRQAKINMINERVKSKVEKLNEMLQTKAEVETKMNSVKSKENRKPTEDRPKNEERREERKDLKSEKKKEKSALQPSIEKEKSTSIVEKSSVLSTDSEISEIAANANAAIDVVEKIS